MTISRPAAEPNDKPDQRPSELLFSIVGLGASAGGMEALLQFFKHMPDDSGMAFVVIVHLSPTHESNVDQILQRVTKMPVTQVKEDVPIEANHIYVISPASHLSINDGHLYVSKADRPRERRIAIDLFFRELADAHKERSFAAILSGTGSDGSVGISRIKEQGGLTFAQLPSDAQFEDMPRKAIDTGAIDFVMPVVDMPKKLIEILANASQIEPSSFEDPPESTHPLSTIDKAAVAERSLQEILLLLRTRTAHDFQYYKRATVLRRIKRRMQVNDVSDMPSYRNFLHAHPEEAPALLKDMLIGVTNFFRNRAAYEVLEREIVPQLFEHGELNDKRTIRVWTPGCSTGEEAYSLAMLLSEYAETQAIASKVQVFATDIDGNAITTARTALYPEAIITDVSAGRLQKFFTKNRNLYQVKKEVRDRILFAEHNLLRDPPFSRLHMISCRNLLIYLDRQAQSKILRMFHFSLVPGGFLFLGSSESADMADDLFTVIDKKHRIYQAKNVSAMARPMLGDRGDSLLRATSPAGYQSIDRDKKKFSYADVHSRVLELHAPPSVIVTLESEILHVSDRAGRFLRYAGGEPSHNLLSLIHPELQLELRTALFQAIHSGHSVEARRVQLKRDDRSYYVNMVVRPFRDEEVSGRFVLVLFDEVEKSLSPELGDPGEESRDSVLTQLKNELQALKIRLQDTIEHSETSIEELKASNEKLQAFNEELQNLIAESDASETFESLRLIAESTTDYAIITLDEQGAITGWNRGAELIFGYRSDEVLGQPGDIIFTPEDRVWITVSTRNRMAFIEARSPGEGKGRAFTVILQR